MNNEHLTALEDTIRKLSADLSCLRIQRDSKSNLSRETCEALLREENQAELKVRAAELEYQTQLFLELKYS